MAAIFSLKLKVVVFESLNRWKFKFKKENLQVCFISNAKKYLGILLFKKYFQNWTTKVVLVTMMIKLENEKIIFPRENFVFPLVGFPCWYFKLSVSPLPTFLEISILCLQKDGGGKYLNWSADLTLRKRPSSNVQVQKCTLTNAWASTQG